MPAAKKHARSPSATSALESDPGLKHPSTKRAKEIDADPPFSQLTSLLQKSSKSSDDKPRNVLHWFRSKDLRMHDNRGLHAAGAKAKEGGGSLIAMYLHSPKDLEWHGTSPARTDFILQSLSLLKKELAEKNIPLAIVTAAERKEKVDKVLEFVQKWDVSHVFANMEYEVDELRRDIKFVEHVTKSGKVAVEILHDQTAVVPGELKTGSGGAQKVFTPYHKAWLAETKENPGLYDTVDPPEGNDSGAKKQFAELFDSKVPDLPKEKQFESSKERDRLRKLWPAGHKAGIERLNYFLDKKVGLGVAIRLPTCTGLTT